MNNVEALVTTEWHRTAGPREWAQAAGPTEWAQATGPKEWAQAAGPTEWVFASRFYYVDQSYALLVLWSWVTPDQRDLSRQQVEAALPDAHGLTGEWVEYNEAGWKDVTRQAMGTAFSACWVTDTTLTLRIQPLWGSQGVHINLLVDWFTTVCPTQTVFVEYTPSLLEWGQTYVHNAGQHPLFRRFQPVYTKHTAAKLPTILALHRRAEQRFGSMVSPDPQTDYEYAQLCGYLFDDASQGNDWRRYPLSLNTLAALNQHIQHSCPQRWMLVR